MNVRYDGCHPLSLFLQHGAAISSCFSLFQCCFSLFTRRPTNDCSLKDWETPFSQSQCVSPVIARGQSRGDTHAEWLPLKQSDLLRRWLVSHRLLIFRQTFRPPPARRPSSIQFTIIQVTHAAHAFCEIFIINGNEVKWIV